jgi:hypothetical protein
MLKLGIGNKRSRMLRRRGIQTLHDATFTPHFRSGRERVARPPRLPSSCGVAGSRDLRCVVVRPLRLRRLRNVQRQFWRLGVLCFTGREVSTRLTRRHFYRELSLDTWRLPVKTRSTLEPSRDRAQIVLLVGSEERPSDEVSAKEKMQLRESEMGGERNEIGATK